MKWKNTNNKDLGKIIKKLDLEPTKTKRRSPHPVYWYYLDGKKVLRIIFPNTHGGSGGISVGFMRQIINNLKLSAAEYENLVECPLTADSFERLVRERIKI